MNINEVRTIPNTTITVMGGSTQLTGTLTYTAATRELHIEPTSGMYGTEPLDESDLYGPPECLSINVGPGYGITAEPGQVCVKDWSEHAGLAQSLIDAGVATAYATASVGPFDSRVYVLDMQV